MFPFGTVTGPDHRYCGSSSRAGTLSTASPLNAVKFPIGIMTSSAALTTPEELGAAFRAARIARGLRLEDLALAAGVGRRFLGELERGKPTVRLAETLRVADALGVSITMNDPNG
jgi:HTH-type transcriptional regulator/antitoxin HipB